MLTAYYNTEKGIICGKVKLHHFIRCLMTANKPSYEKIMVALYPIKGQPFYENYDFLLAPQEKVLFAIQSKKNFTALLR